MNKDRLHVTFLAILLLTACGGGSSEPKKEVTPTTPATPTKITTPIFTEDNAGNVGTISLVTSESAMDLIDEVESEILWFHHAPTGVLKRTCNTQGYVEKKLITDKNNYTLQFHNCDLATEYGIKIANKPLESGESTPVFNGDITISQSNIQLNDQILPQTNNFNITEMTIHANSSNFKVSERETEEDHFTLSFSLDFTTKQQWKSISEVQPFETSKNYYLNKEKISNIETFLLKINYDDVISERELLSNSKIIQILDNNSSNNIPYYKIDLVGDIESSLANFSGSISASLIDENISGDIRHSKGRFTISNIQDETVVLDHISSHEINIYLGDKKLGYFEGNDWYDSALFNMYDNLEMLVNLHLLTPLELISITQTKIANSNKELITATYNKHLDTTHSQIYLDSILINDDEFQITHNQLSTEIDSSIKFGLFHILLSGSSGIDEQQLLSPYNAVIGGIGEIVNLDKNYNQLIYLKSKNIFISYAQGSDYNQQLFMLNANDGSIANTSNIPHDYISDLCLSQDESYVYHYIKTSIHDYEKLAQVSTEDFLETTQHDIASTSFTSGKITCLDNGYNEYGPIVDSNGKGWIRDKYFNFDSNTYEYLALGEHTLSGMRENYKWIPKNIKSKSYIIADKARLNNEIKIYLAELGELPTSKVHLATFTPDYSQGFLEADIFYNKNNNQVLMYNKVISAITPSIIVHEFVNTDEIILYFNEKNNIIVTNYAVYDATTFTVKINLPKLKVNINGGLSVSTLLNTWYIDNNNRLGVLLEDKNKIFRVQL